MSRALFGELKAWDFRFELEMLQPARCKQSLVAAFFRFASRFQLVYWQFETIYLKSLGIDYSFLHAHIVGSIFPFLSFFFFFGVNGLWLLYSITKFSPKNQMQNLKNLSELTLLVLPWFFESYRRQLFCLAGQLLFFLSPFLENRKRVVFVIF